MQNQNRAGGLFLIAALLAWSCIDPYNPPEINQDYQFLVFDGFLNINGTDTSWVRLSRTQNVHDPAGPQYETGAEVSVEGERGAVYQFQPHPNRPGTYFLAPQNFSLAQRYRASVSTGDKKYESTWQTVAITPPIDSITYEVKGQEGLEVYVNTHDPANQSRFYKWTFEETWEYMLPLKSNYEVVNGRVVERQIDINRCWNSFNSTQINLFTTATLSQDVVKKHPITFVSASTNKLILGRYSILVKQQVLSREAFDYWTMLAKNNETNGSIFDPFPSQLTGNFTCTSNPSEAVFGFFSGGTVQSTRVFINEIMGRGYVCGDVDTVGIGCINESSYLIIDFSEDAPSDANEIECKGPPWYHAAALICLDCRAHGGTLERPSFWR